MRRAPVAVKQPESAVTTECRNWLIAKGWRPHRNHCGEFFTRDGRRLSGEQEGTPDWSFTYPTSPGHARFVFVEMKATGGKPRKNQMERIAILEHKGYVVIVADSLEKLKREIGALYG